MKNNFSTSQLSTLPNHNSIHSNININHNNITKFEQNIEQIPAKDNDYTAICTTNIATKDLSFSSFGVATPDMINEDTNTQQLLEAASHMATQKAAYMLSQSHNAPPVTIEINPTPQLANPISVNSNQQEMPKKKYNHSPNKRMSDSQLQALQRIAIEKQVPLASAALQATGKNVEDLSSYDANNLFVYYKKIQYQ